MVDYDKVHVPCARLRPKVSATYAATGLWYKADTNSNMLTEKGLRAELIQLIDDRSAVVDRAVAMAV